MALNGIDVASYQTGLNPAKVPCDFVIVKATQGTTYTNPDFVRMANAVIAAGKLLGIYHYGAGGNPISEANFFYDTIKPYIGKAILALDWEKDMNPAFGKNDVDWSKKFLDHVKTSTGVTAFIYMSKISGCRAHNWSAVAKDYPLWGAQYASNNHTGYQSSPWTDSGSWGAWDKVTIFQYSSHGRLFGWNENLDMDLAYMNSKEWSEWASGKPVEDPFPGKSDTDLAVEVLFNAHGVDEARRKKLGTRWSGAQAQVDKLLDDKSKFSLILAIQRYLKKHGFGELVK